MSTEEVDNFISTREKRSNSNLIHLSILDVNLLVQEHYKKSEEYKANSIENLQLLDQINKKLEEKIEEINNLINNSQNLNNDTSKYIKLTLSHKELQENVNSLLSQKQTIEQRLERKAEEIVSLSQTIEKDVQLIETKESEIKNLEKINTNLKEEASKYQSALGAATNYQLGDDDNNNSVRLNEDIARLQDMLEDYVTNLRKTGINYKKVNRLFTKYQCDLEMKSRIKDFSLIKAVLQRHVIETICEEAAKYFGHLDHKDVKNTGKSQLLESEINSRIGELIDLMDKFTKERSGIHDVTSAVPIKIRQQIFAALSNHGFSDIIDNNRENHEHNFIAQFKKQLNHEMESYREIKDLKKKKGIEEKAPDIIREVVRLFFFRLKTQEPIAKWKWFKNNDKIDPIQMTGSWDEDDIEDATIEICIFPLIYKDSNSSSSTLQIYTPAKVFIRDNYGFSSSESEEENNKKGKFRKIFNKFPLIRNRSK